MNTYNELIQTFLQTQIPLSANPAVKFEAIYAAIMGTKQRRFGPLPSPEIQVAVRDFIRKTDGSPLTFFMPWGSRKQNDGAPLDILEFMAIRQLACLREELARQGQESRFVFRLEDLTDGYLFDIPALKQSSRMQSYEYMNQMTHLAGRSLVKAELHSESNYISQAEFTKKAEEFRPTFLKVLNGELGSDDLKSIGWTGTLPQEQRDYYAHAYGSYWPGASQEVIHNEMAKYFAATLARVKLGATGAPADPHLLIAFTHPVPGNPVSKTRLHYRTIPERYTNRHLSPWIGKGYLEIHEDNRVVPKAAGVHEDIPGLVECKIDLDGISISADYVLK